MARSTVVQAPSRRRRRRKPVYRLRDFVRAYLTGLAAVFVAASINPMMTGIAVLVTGVFMSRFVSGRVIWWNQADSLENVFRSKVHMFLAWPLSMPLLIMKIALSKWL